jgi:WD40 repeat protein
VLLHRAAAIPLRPEGFSMKRDATWLAAVVLLLACRAQETLAGDDLTTATLKGHKNTISSLAFAADGKTLASGAKDGTVILWDLATDKARATLPGHKDMVTAVAFTPDGKTVASAGHDGIVYLWSAADGKQVATLEGHDKDVRGLAFAPDGKTLATGGIDRNVTLWDVGKVLEQKREK